MDHKWKAAAEANGGKHAKHVEQMHGELKKHGTPQDRLNAAIDAGCHQLQAMKHDGSTPDDVVEALSHVVANASTLKDAIAHGVAD